MFDQAGRLLKVDGYGWLARRAMFAKGLRWMFSKRGAAALPSGTFLCYFRPSFHPSDWEIMSGDYIAGWLVSRRTVIPWWRSTDCSPDLRCG
jgi:predicted metal-dependent hydrolase